MVYINSRGEVVDDTRPSPTNIFWKIITFFVLFFRSLLGIEDKPDKKNDDRNRRGTTGFSSGFFGGGGGGGGPSNDNKGSGSRKFGPRGFKSVTDLPPAPPPCAAGACGPCGPCG